MEKEVRVVVEELPFASTYYDEVEGKLVVDYLATIRGNTVESTIEIPSHILKKSSVKFERDLPIALANSKMYLIGLIV